MIRTIIIDDEKDARFLLKNQLKTHFSEIIQIVGEAEDVLPGLDLIYDQKPDLVFLDIRLRKGTGFDILRQLNEINFEVIFSTAYDNYAVEAFQFSAFSYLLKPIKTAPLRMAIQKLKEQFEPKKIDMASRVNVLIENYGEQGSIKKLVVNHVDGFKVIPINTIIRLEGDKNYTHFIIENDRRIVSSKNLGSYEDLLNDFGFIRVHQSTIINLSFVKGYIKGDGGKAEMADGESVQISRQRKMVFLDRFIK